MAQPICLGIFKRGKHITVCLHAAEMLTNDADIAQAREAPIGGGADRKLPDQAGLVLLSEKPLTEGQGLLHVLFWVRCHHRFLAPT